MNFRALIPILLWVALPLPAIAQEPDPSPAPTPPVKGRAAPLKVDPARDLFDYASLNFNSAAEEKDAKKREAAYRSAAKSFDRLIRKFPKNKRALESWYFLGLCYREVGEAEASRACFEAVATNWNSGKFVEASALFLASDDYKAEKWTSAAKWFKIVAKTTKDDKVKHESLYRIFLCYNKLDDKPNILLALRAVIFAGGSPFEEKARLAISRLYQNTQSPQQAYDNYTLLADSKNDEIRAEATLQSALTAQVLGKKELTKTWFKKALNEKALKEQHPNTQLALMGLHYEDEEWAQVIDAYKVGKFKLAKEAELQRLIMAAKSYEALGQKSEVLKLYGQIAKISPGSASSYQAAYRVLIRDHENKDRNFARSAESFLKNYSTENPKDPKIHSVRLLLAEHYYAAKNHARAIEHYRDLDLTLIDPSNVLAVRYHVAKSQLALKNDKGALAAISAFIRQFPTAKQSTQLRLDRAELLTSSGREAEALDDYQSVLTATGDQNLKRVILLRLSAAYQEKKDWKNFTAMQEKILLLPNLDQKTEASANFWLGWNEFRLKKAASAEPYLRKARSLDPKNFTPKVGPLLVRAAYQAEDTALLEREINLLRASSKETKLPSAIVRWLGATLSKAGEHKRAWPFLHEGLADKSSPASPLIWKLYAHTALQTAHFPDALRGADAILTLEKNAYRKAEALHLKAQAHIGMKKYNDARQATSDALDLRPQGDLDVRLRLFAGDIDMAEGKPGDAIKHYTIVQSLYAKTEADKKEALEKVIAALKAIGTPEALKQLKNYQR